LVGSFGISFLLEVVGVGSYGHVTSWADSLCLYFRAFGGEKLAEREMRVQIMDGDIRGGVQPCCAE
jgi:hypothetical protein